LNRDAVLLGIALAYGDLHDYDRSAAKLSAAHALISEMQRADPSDLALRPALAEVNSHRAAIHLAAGAAAEALGYAKESAQMLEEAYRTRPRGTNVQVLLAQDYAVIGQTLLRQARERTREPSARASIAA